MRKENSMPGDNVLKDIHFLNGGRAILHRRVVDSKSNGIISIYRKPNDLEQGYPVEKVESVVLECGDYLVPPGLPIVLRIGGREIRFGDKPPIQRDQILPTVTFAERTCMVNPGSGVVFVKGLIPDPLNGVSIQKVVTLARGLPDMVRTHDLSGSEGVQEGYFLDTYQTIVVPRMSCDMGLSTFVYSLDELGSTSRIGLEVVHLSDDMAKFFRRCNLREHIHYGGI